MNVLPDERDFAEVAALQGYKCDHRDTLGQCLVRPDRVVSGVALCWRHAAEAEGKPLPKWQPRASRYRQPQQHPAFLK